MNDLFGFLARVQIYMKQTIFNQALHRQSYANSAARKTAGTVAPQYAVMQKDTLVLRVDLPPRITAVIPQRYRQIFCSPKPATASV